MEYKINPTIGINQLHLNQPSAVIHTELGAPDQATTLPDGDIREMYQQHSLFVEYQQGKVVAFEIMPEAEAVLNDKNIFALSYLEILSMLRARDSEVEKHMVYRGDDVESLTSRKLGISVWLPDGVNGKPGSVVVFSPGYYD